MDVSNYAASVHFQQLGIFYMWIFIIQGLKCAFIISFFQLVIRFHCIFGVQCHRFFTPPLHPSLQLDSIVTNRSISGSCQSFDYRFFIFEFFGMIQSTGWCHVWHYLHNLHCPGLIRFETTRKSSQWRRSTARVTWPGRLVEDVVQRSIFGASWTRCRLPTVNLISKLWCFVGPFVALHRFLFIYFFFCFIHSTLIESTPSRLSIDSFPRFSWSYRRSVGVV